MPAGLPTERQACALLAVTAGRRMPVASLVCLGVPAVQPRRFSLCLKPNGLFAGMPNLKPYAHRAPLLGLVIAAAIVVVAAAAGIAAVLLVIFPAAAWLVGYFLPDWVFIIPVFGSLSGAGSAALIAAGVVLATGLIQTALWLSRRSALRRLLSAFS